MSETGGGSRPVGVDYAEKWFVEVNNYVHVARSTIQGGCGSIGVNCRSNFVQISRFATNSEQKHKNGI